MLTRTILPWLLGLAGLLSAWPQGQEPKPAPTPEKPADQVLGKPTAHTLEGVYELRKRVAGGQNDAQSSRGYIAITSRHMFLCLAGPGTDPEQPLLRSGVRTWKPEDEFVRCELKLGYFGRDTGASDAVTPTWRDRWDDRQRLPLLVRVDVKPVKGAAWPTLVVEPRRALEAGCRVFDPMRSRCARVE